MKTRTLLVVTAVVIGLIGPDVACAKRGQVTVRVINTTEQGKEKKVEGAQVEIIDPETLEVVGEGKTDKKGNAKFSGLEGKKEYTIRVTAVDGKVTTASFTTNKNGGAGLQQVNIAG